MQTCYYDHRNRYKSRMCQSQVDRVRRKFNELHARHGVPVNHYYNTPSCHDVENETPFYERYEIKKFFFVIPGARHSACVIPTWPLLGGGEGTL